MSLKNLLTITLVVADAALLVLSLLLMLAGYRLWGAVALLAAGGLVFAAARFWLNTPEPAAAPAREWHVWDEELEDGLSDVERQMLRAHEGGGRTRPPTHRHLRLARKEMADA